MLKDAIEKIVSLANPMVSTVGDRTYVFGKDGNFMEVEPDLDMVQGIQLNSLDAIVKFVTSEAVRLTDSILYLTIPNHLTVNCFTSPDKKCKNLRTALYEAKATDVPGWAEKMQLGFEEAQISLRTRFQHTNDVEYAQKLLSDITTGCKVTYNDNGVATTIVTQQGVALQGKTTIRPIINLRPYRTFQEVEQPASDFLIRVNDRYITFIEADGGMWKLTARETVKAYLEEHLAELIADGKVVVAL